MPLSLRNPSTVNKNANVVEAQKEEAQKVEAAAVATAPNYSEEVLGSMSDAIAFVAPLGDPSHPDVVKDKDGNVISTPYIVGYRFKALRDIEVPECGLDDDARKNLMSFKDKNGKRTVKAGEEFDLTRFEMGLLLAAPEYNCRITGEGKNFTATYQVAVVKSKNGDLGTASAALKVPTVALKMDTGSIKDYKIIDVLSFTTDPETKKKIRTINPGFEKWEPLCKVQAQMSRASSGSSTPKNIRNQKADAFLQIVAKK